MSLNVVYLATLLSVWRLHTPTGRGLTTTTIHVNGGHVTHTTGHVRSQNDDRLTEMT